MIVHSLWLCLLKCLNTFNSNGECINNIYIQKSQGKFSENVTAVLESNSNSDDDLAGA